METEKLIEDGKIICSHNPFYETLSLLLKYFFCDNTINIMDIIKDVTKNELEFQTFMIYKNYGLDLYYTHKQYMEDISYDNTVYFIISLVKNNYDKNRNVISPYIFSIESNKYDVIEKYHCVKSVYSVKNEKMNNLNKIINLLEEAKLYDKKANDCRNNAMNLLYNIKETYTANLHELKL